MAQEKGVGFCTFPCTHAAFLLGSKRCKLCAKVEVAFCGGDRQGRKECLAKGVLLVLTILLGVISKKARMRNLTLGYCSLFFARFSKTVYWRGSVLKVIFFYTHSRVGLVVFHDWFIFLKVWKIAAQFCLDTKVTTRSRLAQIPLHIAKHTFIAQEKGVCHRSIPIRTLLSCLEVNNCLEVQRFSLLSAAAIG